MRVLQLCLPKQDSSCRIIQVCKIRTCEDAQKRAAKHKARKKETNTLYTINALNELIKKLNGGIVDTSYRVEWPHYRNSILLTQHNELKQLKTKIFKILDI